MKSVSDGFESLRTNKVLMQVGFLAFVVAELISLSSMYLFLNPFFFGGYFLQWSFYAFAIATTIISLLVVIFLYGAYIAAVVANKKISVAECFATSARKYVTLIVSSVMATLALIAGLVALIIPGIYVAVRLAIFYNFAIFKDNKNAIESLKKSWAVVKGNWWRVFALLIILGLIDWAAGIVITMLTFFGLPSYLFSILTNVVQYMFLTPLFFATMYSAYKQLSGSRRK